MATSYKITQKATIFLSNDFFVIHLQLQNTQCKFQIMTSCPLYVCHGLKKGHLAYFGKSCFSTIEGHSQWVFYTSEILIVWKF